MTAPAKQREREDDVLMPHMHAYGLGSILDLAEEELGKQTVQRWVDEWGVDVRHLIETQSWVSWGFCEKVLDRLATEGGRELVTRVGRGVMTPKHMGAIYPFVRSFGTPLFTYERIVGATPRFNKVVSWELDKLGPRRIRLTGHRQIDVPRTGTSHLCEVLRAQMASVPVLFDLPPARVVHDECYHRGADECIFEIEWQEADGRVSPWLVLLAGSGGGFVLGSLLGAALYPLIATTVLGGVATWATVLAYRQRRDLADRIADIQDHHDALGRSVRDNELRFEELLEAKREVDAKVEERTAELAETSRQLAETLEEVRNLDQAKTDFFSNVSHELRTPLTLMLAPLDDLAAGTAPPGGRDATLAAMKRNGTRLLTLINQLLDLAKIDAGAATLTRTAIRPADLVRRVADAFQPAAASRGIALVTSVPTGQTSMALDVDRIEAALTNLVANALRFAARRISIQAEDTGGEILFSVEDDGVGIPTEQQKDLFERFSQPGAGARRPGGTGLGLALVRETARLHGGEVTVVSEPNVRTVFRLVLPRIVAQASTPPAPNARQSPAELASLPPPTATAELTREPPRAGAPVALVVEDDPDLRAFIADVLAPRFAVHAVADGRRALEAVELVVPDVVVSDVAMPGIDGIELTKALRQLERTRTTPILLVTARSDTRQVLEGFEAGADDYLTKPFHGRELLARVDVHLRIRKVMQHLAHQERLAALGVVAASVAHNVRNALLPLTSGLPSVRSRLSASLDEGSEQMFDVMQDSADRIARLSTDLLDLSRIEKEKQGKFQPGHGLLASVRLVSAKVPPSVEITAEVDETVVVFGRPGDMNHVFLNLVDNAARAVGDEGGTIRVEGRSEGDEYVVEVMDSGPGVSAELRSKIFEPFVTTRGAGEGTGLGLAIARDVVRQHGGTLDVGGCDLGGAAFTIRLPLAKGDHAVS